ncbi:16S rRNA (uracil(1498)-N(3))-methyltransferase [Demequina zhanjiangensis]|uniref:Ribosomal RNA small subunit methyltransferase E n=1 Tax=Demequina zhanjiangensis TaxID=3051659 RepID=A0ABT8G083_9MICO|nr:16S rRNA (uracil(1498)-N(3))-methyltransferase [Demequina sp. SYSU T00b26]MDN4472497.1 16S rRNA (uracil(1498)-N(3))-methyltransferase [Demequina sp. SYSU T00b26]
MTAPVFLCPAAADAAVGDLVPLDGPEARHALTVQRRGVGEVIDLADGHGRRAGGPIHEIGDGWLKVQVQQVSDDADPSVTLVQALAKGGRDEQAVESCVELGVTGVVPWQADRSIVQWRGPKAEKARAKWESLVLAAMKQSRRAFLPEVDSVVTTGELVSLVKASVAAGERVLVLHEVAAQPLTRLAWEGPTQPITIIVGPEGGVSDAEISRLTEVGAEPVLLGPHVLRAANAGPAAVAALAALRSTW